jgi:hypothetical protein
MNKVLITLLIFTSLIILLSLTNVLKFNWKSQDLYTDRVYAVTCRYKGILFKIYDFNRIIIVTDQSCTNI